MDRSPFSFVAFMKDMYCNFFNSKICKKLQINKYYIKKEKKFIMQELLKLVFKSLTVVSMHLAHHKNHKNILFL